MVCTDIRMHTAALLMLPIAQSDGLTVCTYTKGRYVRCGALSVLV